MTETIKWVPPMPTDIPEGYFPHWNGDEWVMQERNPPSPPPVPPTEAEVLAMVRAQAKSLLAASDWSMLPDVNIANKAEFESYRAVLRSIMTNPMLNPVWPVEPTTIWL